MRDHAAEHATQRERVLDALQQGGWIDNRDLLRVGGARYGGRLLELKRIGWTIEDRPSTRNPGKEYRLGKLGPPQPKRVKVYLGEADAWQASYGHLTESAREAIDGALRSFTANRDKL